MDITRWFLKYRLCLAVCNTIAEHAALYWLLLAWERAWAKEHARTSHACKVARWYLRDVEEDVNVDLNSELTRTVAYNVPVLSCVTRQASVTRQQPKTAVKARPSWVAETYRVIRFPKAGTLYRPADFLFGQFSLILYPGSRIVIHRRHQTLLNIIILTYYFTYVIAWL